MTAQGGDILAWLDAAITRVEKTAQATTERQPYDEWDAVGAGTESESRRSLWRVIGIATMNPTPAAYDLAQHIALHDPESVLRRCAADRKLLELHRPMDHEGEMAVFCSECDVSGDYPYFPCQTLRILAEGYGWSEQTSLATDQGQTPPIEGDQVT